MKNIRNISINRKMFMFPEFFCDHNLHIKISSPAGDISWGDLWTITTFIGQGTEK